MGLGRHVEAGAPVWVCLEGEYLTGRLVAQAAGDADGFVEVCVDAIGGVTIAVDAKDLFRANRVPRDRLHEVKDLTALEHLHEPAILGVLQSRAYKDRPYTFLSDILVSVNPVVNVPEVLEAGFHGGPEHLSEPHPFALAERAFQQLGFAAANGRPCAQSIVIAGESGAGKTEVSKRVLRHLIARTVPAGGDGVAAGQQSIDARLLGVNPILESFGNAATLRNHNSSRFGKFTKLHFDCGGDGDTRLAYASISSYLLERSRISCHSGGERNFHVFYEFVNGAGAELRARAGLERGDPGRFPGYGFRYLTPIGDAADSAIEAEAQRLEDAASFTRLVDALDTVGLGGACEDIMLTLGGILHLGNVSFEEVESEQGSVAAVATSDELGAAAGLLGLSPEALRGLLLERVVRLPGGEVANVQRKLNESVEARDALAKSLYSGLFDWLFSQINCTFAPAHTGGEHVKETFVGVLDIFGFEAFFKNDFEQLLINFANEALQEAFHETILVAEATLYQSEGLIASRPDAESAARGGDQDCRATCATIPGSSCLDLLMGNRGAGLEGILQALQAESECPSPRDDKFLATLHRQYTSHDKFLVPHPKDRRHNFILAHYAADVTYTIGNFTRKNLDRLPKDAAAVLAESERGFLHKLFGAAAPGVAPGARSKKRSQGKASIASMFSKQMSQLVQELSSTQCSFVRCIKPNWSMSRAHGNGQWVDTGYVLDQMRCLGIPQTAAALRGGGFPTRIDYADVLPQFRDQLPPALLRSCEVLTRVGTRSSVQACNARLVRALFCAYEVPSAVYRCGRTKVFFAAGALEAVSGVLRDSTAGPASLAIQSRFRALCARSAWRSCIGKVLAAQRLVGLLEGVRVRAAARALARKQAAAVRIQSLARGTRARDWLRTQLRASIVLQGVWRMWCARQQFRQRLRVIQKERKKKLLQQEVQEHLEAQIKLCREHMAVLRQQCFEPVQLAAAQESTRIRGSPSQQTDLGAPALPQSPPLKPSLPPPPPPPPPPSPPQNEPSLPRLPPTAPRLMPSLLPPRVQSEAVAHPEDTPAPVLAPVLGIEAADAVPPPLPPKPLHKRPSSRSMVSSSGTVSWRSSSSSSSRRLSGSGSGSGSIRLPPAPPPPPPPKSERTLKRQSVRVLVSSRRSRRSSGAFREDSEEERRRQRAVFLRLRQEERSYVDALSVVSGSYFQPLHLRVSLEDAGNSQSKLILPKRDVDLIFSNLTQLLHLHAQVLSSVEAELARHKQNPQHDMTLGFILSFKETLPFLRKIYAAYVKQHSTSLSVLARCTAESPRFARFLRQTAENKQLPSYGTSLSDLLKLPINQVPRYNEYLHTLLSFASPESAAHEHLQAVCRALEGVSKELGEERRLARLDIRAYEIAQQLEGMGKFRKRRVAAVDGGDRADGGLTAADALEKRTGAHEILHPGRRFLREWCVPLSFAERDPLSGTKGPESRHKQRVFFLFSDVLVVAKRLAARRYEIRMWIDLSKIWVDASHAGGGGGGGGGGDDGGDGGGGSGSSRGNSGGSRVFPLQVVHITAAAERQDSATHPSAALRFLHRRRGQHQPQSGSPRVENLVLRFSSPGQRREIYHALTETSKALKRKRERLSRLQQASLARRHAGTSAAA